MITENGVKNLIRKGYPAIEVIDMSIIRKKGSDSISLVVLRSCFELFEMFFEVKKIFIFFPLLQSDSTAIFLGRSGRT